jgi:hypothetical protein
MLKTILALHIVGGSIALASMFIPLVAAKGGVAHRRGGWVFVGGMTVVSITAFVLAAARFLTDLTPSGRAAGGFLFFVAILTAAGVSAGIRVLRAKRRTAPHRNLWDLGIAAALTISSVAMAAWGLSSGRPLFAAFSLIGLVNGGSQLFYWRRVPTHPMHWWFQHMGSMMGSCIAATTAFLVVNSGRIGFETFALAVWLTPTVIGTPAIIIWTAYYKRKFAAATVTRAAVASAMSQSLPFVAFDARLTEAARHEGLTVVPVSKGRR